MTYSKNKAFKQLVEPTFYRYPANNFSKASWEIRWRNYRIRVLVSDLAKLLDTGEMITDAGGPPYRLAPVVNNPDILQMSIKYLGEDQKTHRIFRFKKENLEIKFYEREILNESG